MRDELENRPYQKNFVDEEELNKEIEELDQLAKQREAKDNTVDNSNYSGATDELEQLSRVFNIINSMKIAQIHCSYIDENLFNKQEETV